MLNVLGENRSLSNFDGLLVKINFARHTKDTERTQNRAAL